MKNLLLVAALFLMPAIAGAQCKTISSTQSDGTTAQIQDCTRVTEIDISPRFLVGITGVDMYNNYSLGVVTQAELPFYRVNKTSPYSFDAAELDIRNEFDPLESHVKIGSGFAESLSATGLGWFTRSWAAGSGVEYSMYSITGLRKSADYVRAGLTYRGLVWGAPTRVSFGWVGEFNNGIDKKGVESSHLEGGYVDVNARWGCTGPLCWRVDWQIQGGRVLTQGNPVCDGTFGTKGGNGPGGSCPRTPAMGGGAAITVSLEFPRHKGRENEAF